MVLRRESVGWLGGLAAALLVLVACGGASTVAPPVETSPDVLYSPTEVSTPFDLDGGATISDDGVRIEQEDPRSELLAAAASISGEWGTDWTRQTVPLSDFAAGLRGLDPRDGIPPVDVPKFETVASGIDWLGPNDPGALVVFAGEARFYPLGILTRHEIINDRIGDIPIAITYCPLCNTAVTFDRRVSGEVLRFGVSGLLRNSDLVMWDDLTDSLWQQITGEAVVGRYAGTDLEVVPTSIVSFGDFELAHPDGLSLSRETGFAISNYGLNPYDGYSTGGGPIASFINGPIDNRLPALERVVAVGRQSPVAYPFSVLEAQPAINDEVDQRPIVIFFGGTTADALDGSSISDSEEIGSGIAYERQINNQVLTFRANDDDTFADAETGSTWTLLGQAIDGPLEGEQLAIAPHRNEFWFAFAAFFPEAKLYEN